MHRALAVAVAILALAATPARGAEVTVAVGDDFFNPQTVQIAVGDTVKWVFAQDSVGNHSITTKSQQPESFDSDPGKPEALISHPPGYTYSHTFNSDNVEVDYFCKVHPVTMDGKVVVGVPPPDTTPPGLDPAKPKVRRSAVKVPFELTEAAQVELRLASAGRPRRNLRTVRKQLGAGDRVMTLRRGGLPPGRYIVKLTARDEAGNQSGVVRAAFRLKPPRR